MLDEELQAYKPGAAWSLMMVAHGVVEKLTDSFLIN